MKRRDKTEFDRNFGKTQDKIEQTTRILHSIESKRTTCSDVFLFRCQNLNLIIKSNISSMTSQYFNTEHVVDKKQINSKILWFSFGQNYFGKIIHATLFARVFDCFTDDFFLATIKARGLKY